MRIEYILLLGLLFISACTVSEVTTSGTNEPLVDKINTDLKTEATNIETTPIIDTKKDLTGITEDELSRHSLETNCWISYEGKVYDVTDFLPKHPGSAQAIIPYCGTSEEFESAFVGKHGREMAKKLTEVSTYKGNLV